MNLTQYLKKTGERPYKFAVRAGVSVPLVYGVVNMEKGKGHREILLKSALKIQEASEGLISLEKLGRHNSQP